MKKPILLFFILVSFTLSGQNVAFDQLISADQLKEDLSILRTNLEQLHGALYLYSSKEQIDAKFEEIEAELNKEMSSIDFYMLTSPILKLIGNGHTQIVPSKSFYKKMRSEMKYFPLDLYVDKGLVYILRNNSENEQIAEGDIVEKINGINTLDLIEEIANRLTRDGNNESWPMTRATNRFSEYYIFNYGDKDIYNCKIKKVDGESREFQLSGKTKSKIKIKRIAKYGESKNWFELKKPAYTLDFDNTTAVMTLRTFSNEQIKKTNKMKSKQWFANSFEQINKQRVEKLIIDMRGNGGGDEDPTIELFSHLHDKEFQFYKDVFLEERKIPNGELYNDNIFFLNIFAKLVTKKKNGKYLLKSKGLKPYKPAKEQFKGKVIVLTDANSFSATGEMTAILKEYDRVTFVGEEPGGNPNQNTSGSMLILNLPHSGLRTVVPIVVFEMNVSFPNTGRGVIPDHKVKNSIWDEIEGNDAVIEFAKALK